MADSREHASFSSLGVRVAGMLFLPQGAGKFPAVIMCHGAGDRKEEYYPLAEFLSANGFAVLCIDMHGHGESGGARGHVKMSEWVQDLRGAIDHLERDPRIDKEKIGAFGLSSGGTVILETAIVDKRLKSLVALDATVRDSLPMLQSLAFRTLVAIGSIKKFFTGSDWRISLKMFGEMKLAEDPKVNEEILSDPKFKDSYLHFPLPGASESFIVDTIKRVGKITAPTLVLWGEGDKIDPPDTGKLLFEALQCEKELHIIEGNGHAGHLDARKDKVYEYTLAWLRKTLGKIG